jgi:LysM repeat protein
MNCPRFVALLSAIIIAGFALTTPVHSRDLTEEYNQVRKIALKDPKVRAAFKKANEELEKRIIAIDPSLKPFIEKQRATKNRGTEVKKSAVNTTHVVAKGETLTSIARHHHVSVNSLLRANHISKQATLQVGQKLVIPAGG